MKSSYIEILKIISSKLNILTNKIDGKADDIYNDKIKYQAEDEAKQFLLLLIDTIHETEYSLDDKSYLTSEIEIISKEYEDTPINLSNISNSDRTEFESILSDFSSYLKKIQIGYLSKTYKSIKNQYVSIESEKEEKNRIEAAKKIKYSVIELDDYVVPDTNISIPEVYTPEKQKQVKREFINKSKVDGVVQDTIHINPKQIELARQDLKKDKPNTRYLSFEEAKKIAQNFKFITLRQWYEYHKNNNPKKLPLHPHQTYRDSGWVSWKDWLGVPIISINDFLAFEQALEITNCLGLKNKKEWIEYCKNGNKPNNIPSAPDVLYKNKWQGWSYFLGRHISETKDTMWTKEFMLSFIMQIENQMLYLDSVELAVILSSNGLIKKLKTQKNLNDLLLSRPDTEPRIRAIKNIIESLQEENNSNESFDSINSSENSEEVQIVDTEDISSTHNINISGLIESENKGPFISLKALDENSVITSMDDERIDFLIKNGLKKVWTTVFDNPSYANKFLESTGGTNFTKIHDLFKEEYDAINKISFSEDYIFSGEPLLMQKLICHRLKKEKRYGNWSGTGAGKTISAILAGRHVGAKNTLIITFNSTIHGWEQAIKECFSNNKIYSKKEKNYVLFEDNTHNYLILNYESFQQNNSYEFINSFLENNYIDYIILDEVQKIKQRDIENESKRKRLINKLITNVADQNPDLYILAMSANPFVNNLEEPKKLIELMTGEIHDDIKTINTIQNAIKMYKIIIKNGLRYVPEHNIDVSTYDSENMITMNIDGCNISNIIANINKPNILALEQVLIDEKLKSIRHLLKPGVIIYSHYVSNIINKVQSFIEKEGFTTGLYTGSCKTGFEDFINKKIDILISSSPLSTGMDGLQKISNKLIILTLPWTHAEYLQLQGRIRRQGSVFNNIEIYIPQVTIHTDNKMWSWDIQRLNFIKYKGTLANLCIDGILPKDADLPERKSLLLKSASEELKQWIERVKNNELTEIKRKRIDIFV